MTTINTVLIANRGEIAERIIRTCHLRGVRSIAVYSDADAALPFVRAADQSRRLGATSADSYLDGAAIIATALELGADAIHPGYGFLSENADFARAVSDAGLVFIGPSGAVIDQLGRKDRAREIAERAGVPVTPHYSPESVPDDAWPVLVKAAAGGGGKGMHLVGRAEDLPDALATAAREARAAFGDETLLIEKYVTGGRHVEVQVFGDHHGSVVHLFERDCSVQRRHQKIIEEAPAPGLDPQVRERILAASVALCREVGYTNAGTVEFLVDGSDAWFLEMNTRLQVEHPVTEEITGLDLVDWQLRVASGEPLPLTQDEITCTGHAIEVRVYAEDPYREFLPQIGFVRDLVWPDDQARMETGIAVGTTVGTAFDPMLAKVITSGKDRRAAIAAMTAALDRTAILGVVTNVGFVRRLLASEEFDAVAIHTGWLDERPEDAFRSPECPDEVFAEAARLLNPPHVGALPFDGWRSSGPARSVQVRLQAEGEEPQWVAPATGPVTDGIHAVTDTARAWLSWQGQSWIVSRVDPMRRDHVRDAGGPEVHAPMPGVVLMVEVEVGQRVRAGDRLAVLEAMKMELALTAPLEGTVTRIVAVGTQVTMGQVLCEITEDDDA